MTNSKLNVTCYECNKKDHYNPKCLDINKTIEKHKKKKTLEAKHEDSFLKLSNEEDLC